MLIPLLLGRIEAGGRGTAQECHRLLYLRRAGWTAFAVTTEQLVEAPGGFQFGSFEERRSPIFFAG